MLYEKIRHAEKIRVLSVSRQILKNHKRPNLSSRMRYKKHSSSYYLLKKKMLFNGVLNWEGQFIDSITNNWLAKISQRVRPEELHALGFKPTFDLYLALMFNGTVQINRLAQNLGTSQASTYAGIKKLTDLSLIYKKGSTVRINETHYMFYWMVRYIKLAMIQADLDMSMVPLFDCVPGYIDGPQAHSLTHYEPGRPIRPYDTIIRTGIFFKSFWDNALKNMEYFTTHPKKIKVLIEKDDREIIWFSSLPLNKNSEEVF